MKTIDILGASAATLSMIFELLSDQYADEEINVRIIKNVSNELDHDFAIARVSYEIKSINEVERLSKEVLLGVYQSETKKKVYNDFSEKYDLSQSHTINLLHSQTAIATSVILGRGVQINPMSTLAPFSHLGDFVSVNRNVSIGHHTKIGNFCTINPGVHVAGHCKIDEGVTIGMGAVVLDGKSVGKNSIIAAGALITKDVPSNVLVMGTPAKVIKQL